MTGDERRRSPKNINRLLRYYKRKRLAIQQAVSPKPNISELSNGKVTLLPIAKIISDGNAVLNQNKFSCCVILHSVIK